jgi:hypothetical protein
LDNDQNKLYFFSGLGAYDKSANKSYQEHVRNYFDGGDDVWVYDLKSNGHGYLDLPKLSERLQFLLRQEQMLKLLVFSMVTFLLESLGIQIY